MHIDLQILLLLFLGKTNYLKLGILTSRFPYPLEKGDKLRLFHQIRSLSRHFDLYLYAIIDKDVQAKDIDEVRKYCTSIKTYQISSFKRGFNVLKAIFTGLPLQVAYNFDRTVQASILSDIRESKLVVLYCQLARMAHYIKDHNLPKGIDYMDVFSVGMAKRAKIVHPILSLLYQLEAKRTREYEQKIGPHFNFKTIISDQDKSLIGIKNMSVVPNGVDTSFFKPTPSTSLSYDLGFVGNMGYLPNVAAAEFLVNQIAPLIKRPSEPLRISIAGARPHIRVKQLQSDTVTIQGWVEDIRDAYKDIRVFVAPLFNGTGQQNKILEAMAMGIPVVTTSEVNHAIGAEAGKDISIANTATEFKQQIEALLKDPEKINTLSKNGLSFVREKYSWESQNNKLIKLIKNIQ